ncbi:hypothetical protein [Treponema sp.]|uniref:hypothetical protein n=1 Tax=Treponema sp. TaxID=166 RepID=UPI003EFD0770
MEIFDDESNPETLSPGEDLVFHYKRGEFRNREQDIFRNLATGKTTVKRGLFKVLFSTRGNKIAFFTLVLCMVFLFIFRILNGGADTNSIAGVSVKISAFAFDGRVYASAEFSNSGGRVREASSVPLEIQFECINEEGSVADKQKILVDFNPASPKPVYAVFNDYDLVSVSCILTCNDEKAVVRCRILNRGAR